MARRTGGVVVNADSMQVYSTLQVITARPRAEDMQGVPHLLYGHVDPATAYSTGRWLRDVSGLIESGVLAGRRPIFVGGTGLYFRALLGGLSEMPGIPPPVRQRWRSKLSEEGPRELHRILMQDDPQLGARLKPTDGQRIVRALEVLEASGRSMTEWQAETGAPLVDAESAERMVLLPDRALLHARIEARFDRMVADGAVEEVQALLALRLDPTLPAMKAIGVPELAEVIAGREKLDAAITKAKVATRQYAKRQMTWFRNQMGPEWQHIEPAGRNPPGER